MALDACDGSFGSCDSCGAVPRPNQSFSMRTVVESIHRPPLEAGIINTLGENQIHSLPFYLLIPQSLASEQQ